MNKILLITILAVSTLSSCSSQTTTTEKTVSENSVKTVAKNIDAAEFKKRAESGEGQILDVRTPGEIAEGYIEGATKIDIFEASFNTKIQELDKNKPVYVYCKSGGRSGKAMSEMKSIGFKEIYNLNGGIGAWDNAGYQKVK